MIEREKGKDHEKMLKKKALGQLIVVKERKGGRMVAGRKGQHKQVMRKVRGEKRKGRYKRKPLQRKGGGICFFLVPR
jgi:hypothetical protein